VRRDYLKKITYLILTLVLIGVLTGCSQYKFKETMEIQVEDFTHTNQHYEEIGLNDLKGKPWLAMFIFTNCATVCPPMTYNMSEVQIALEDEGVEDYSIVAFSVDPKTDTPEILEKYLTHYEIKDETKWHLLTGYDQTYIEQFAKKSFNSYVKLTPDSDQVTHMSSFYLVNAAGTTVKSYNGNIEVPIDTIVQDLKALSE
jgi:protein SCO1